MLALGRKKEHRRPLVRLGNSRERGERVAGAARLSVSSGSSDGTLGGVISEHARAGRSLRSKSENDTVGQIDARFMQCPSSGRERDGDRVFVWSRRPRVEPPSIRAARTSAISCLYTGMAFAVQPQAVNRCPLQRAYVTCSLGVLPRLAAGRRATRRSTRASRRPREDVRVIARDDHAYLGSERAPRRARGAARVEINLHAVAVSGTTSRRRRGAPEI